MVGVGAEPLHGAGPRIRKRLCSGSVARPIISAFRAKDSGSNPDRSNFLPVHLDIITYMLECGAKGGRQAREEGRQKL
mgnify:CR=1 FL=1